MSETTCPWPYGARGALSVTFDDARASQLEAGLPILDRHGARATFYVGIPQVEARLDEWRAAQANGHEIGSHSLRHPCSGNFGFSRATPLEEWDLETITADLLAAHDRLEQWFGAPPRTFAYPCGQKFVGSGEQVVSYVPLVARLYQAGRGFRDEAANDPWRCDLAQLFGFEGDGLTPERAVALAQQAVSTGAWLVLACHDVGDHPTQAITCSALDALCAHCADAANDIWMATVAEVAEVVVRNRG